MDAKKQLIVTDYDGTLKRKEDLNELLTSIDLLRELVGQRIIFMISTGRPLSSIQEEIKKYDIPFHYLSCANGNALFDSSFTPLYKKTIDSSIMSELKPFYKYIKSFMPRDEFGRTTRTKAIEYLIKIEEDLKLRHDLVNFLLENPNIDYVTDGCNKFQLHLFSSSNKTDTIEVVRNIENLTDRDIFTIGDGPNDIEMLEKYNGYLFGTNNKMGRTNTLGHYEHFPNFLSDVASKKLTKRRG